MTTGVCPSDSTSPTTRYHVSCPFQAMRPSRSSTSSSFRGAVLDTDGCQAAERVVAGGNAPIAVVGQRRLDRTADLGCVPAPGVEPAAGRWVDRTRNLTLEHDGGTTRTHVVV